jgi:hypothetical protein
MAFGVPDVCCGRSSLAGARAVMLPWARCTTMSPIGGEMDDSFPPQSASIRESGRQRMLGGPAGADATTSLLSALGAL